MSLWSLLALLGMSFIIGVIVQRLYNMLYPPICYQCAIKHKKETFWTNTPLQAESVQKEPDDDID